MKKHILAGVLFLLAVAGRATAADVTLTVEKQTYATGEDIVVTTSCPPQSSSAWVGLFKSGAGERNYQTYQYVSDGENCRLVFDGQDDPGQYEARYFPDSGYNDQIRVAFAVGDSTASSAAPVSASASDSGSDANTSIAAPSVMTESGIAFDKETYVTGEKIRVTTDCSKYDEDGWIGVFSPSDAPRDYGTYKADWLYFRDREDCIFEFAGRATAGDYELRIIPPSGDFIAARHAFSVAEAGGAKPYTLGKAAYSTNEPIRVTAACGPDAEAGSNWIALFKAGASSYNYGIQGEDWFYFKDATKAGAACTFTFAPRTEVGAYELRQFQGTDYTPVAQMAFEIVTTGVVQEPEQVTETGPGIQMPFKIWLAKDSYAVGEGIDVAVQCHKKEYPASDPWIGIRKISEPLHAHPQRGAAVRFQKDWNYLKNYTQPANDCIYSFDGRSEPGTYEVRVFLALEDCDCSDSLAGRLTFTVGDGLGAGTPPEAEFMLSEAPNRHKQYDYVRAHSNDCIEVDDEQFTNICDFPVSVYFTRKLGYDDEAMQFAETVAPKASADLSFEQTGTVSWLACHTDQTLCGRALACIQQKDQSGEKVLGYMTAVCSAFERE